MIVIVRESHMYVRKRKIRVQLRDLVGIVSAVFVGDGDVFHANSRPLDRRCTVTVLVIPDDTHTTSSVPH